MFPFAIIAAVIGLFAASAAADIFPFRFFGFCFCFIKYAEGASCNELLKKNATTNTEQKKKNPQDVEQNKKNKA